MPGPADVAELAALRMFGEVAPEVLAPLAAASFSKRLSRGQILFSEGEPSEHLYVVRSGRIKVFIDSDRGEELLLTVLGAGEPLGELSAIDGLPRSASVEALEATELLALPMEQVREVLTRSPAALLALAAEVAQEMRRLTGSTADLVFLDLPRRLAKLVLTQGDGHQADLGLTQSELAAMLGVTRQSLNRALSTLQRRGWLDVQGPVLRVLDLAALRRFADS